jgi:hypothetical protein
MLLVDANVLLNMRTAYGQSAGRQLRIGLSPLLVGRSRPETVIDQTRKQSLIV